MSFGSLQRGLAPFAWIAETRTRKWFLCFHVFCVSRMSAWVGESFGGKSSWFSVKASSLSRVSWRHVIRIELNLNLKSRFRILLTRVCSRAAGRQIWLVGWLTNCVLTSIWPSNNIECATPTGNRTSELLFPTFDLRIKISNQNSGPRPQLQLRVITYEFTSSPQQGSSSFPPVT